MKVIDTSTIVISGIDMADYPKFTDAYIESAEYTDGTSLTDEELERLQETNPILIHQMAVESIY